FLLVNLPQNLLPPRINESYVTEIDKELTRSNGRNERMPSPAELRHCLSGNPALDLHRDPIRVLLDRDSQRGRLPALTASLGHAKGQTQIACGGLEEQESKPVRLGRRICRTALATCDEGGATIFRQGD